MYGGGGLKKLDLELSRYRAPIAWRAATNAVLEKTGAPVPTSGGATEAGGRVLGADASHRRKLALYAAVVGLGSCAAHMSALAGVRDRWVREAVERIEEMRDRPDFDHFIDVLIARARELWLIERGLK